MSKQRDIEARLHRLRSEGAEPDTDWHRAYNEYVTYLVNVLKDYGPPLRAKLQQRSIEIEQRESELRRTRMYASLGMLVILGLGLLRFLLGSPALPGPASPETAMSIGDSGAVAGQYSVEPGIVPDGGLRIRPALARYDAEQRHGPAPALTDETMGAPSACRAADVLRGRLHPTGCPEFGRGCTPERPLGAPMVSSEGACAAYFHHRRLQATP